MATNLTPGLVALYMHVCLAASNMQQSAWSVVVSESSTSRHGALREASSCPHRGRHRVICDYHQLLEDLDLFGCPDWMPESECVRLAHHPNCTFPAATCPKDEQPHCDAEFLRDGIILSLEEPCLNGRNTLVAEGFLSPHECQHIVRLNALSHSAVARGAVQSIVASLSKIRHYTEAYFKLRSHLHFYEVRLECHAAPDESSGEESYARDLAWAGICQLQPNRSCMRLDSNTKWRHYSAVLFLNDDFEGGHFVLTGTSRMGTAGTARPKCGRSVIVAGNLPYGYLPLHRGRQCRLVLDLTHAADHRDKDTDELVKAAAKEQLYDWTKPDLVKSNLTKRDPTKRRKLTVDGGSTAFFMNRLQPARPISMRCRIKLVVAAMAPILVGYMGFFSYNFYNYMHPDRKLNFLNLFA